MIPTQAARFSSNDSTGTSEALTLRGSAAQAQPDGAFSWLGNDAALDAAPQRFSHAAPAARASALAPATLLPTAKPLGRALSAADHCAPRPVMPRPGARSVRAKKKAVRPAAGSRDTLAPDSGGPESSDGRDSFEPVWTGPDRRAPEPVTRSARSWFQRQGLGVLLGLTIGLSAGATGLQQARPLAAPSAAEVGIGEAFSSVSAALDLPIASIMRIDPTDHPADLGAPVVANEDDRAECAAEPAVEPALEPVGEAPLGQTVAAQPIAAERPARSSLQAQTVELLGQRRFAEAEPSARALVAAEPKVAFGYLCLGAALLELGRKVEAHEVFRDCVRHASRDGVDECVSFGGRR